MPFRALGEPPKSSDYLDSEIFHFCGIFTVFSIVVSIYTLTSSSIDRYLAVRFPIKYKPGIHELRTTSLAPDQDRNIVQNSHRSVRRPLIQAKNKSCENLDDYHAVVDLAQCNLFFNCTNLGSNIEIWFHIGCNYGFRHSRRQHGN